MRNAKRKTYAPITTHTQKHQTFRKTKTDLIPNKPHETVTNEIKTHRKTLATLATIMTLAFITTTLPAANASPTSLELETTATPGQSLYVSTEAVQAPISRDSYSATSQEEINAILAAAAAEAERVKQEQEAIAAAEKSSNSTKNKTYGIIPEQIIPANSVIEAAEQWVGVVPYGNGNNPSDSFSCDGYTQYVFSQVGISLPRTVSAQYAMGTEIPASEARAGDLLVWVGQHVGIYDGNGGMYDSPDWGRYVQHRTTIWGNPVYVRL